MNRQKVICGKYFPLGTSVQLVARQLKLRQKFLSNPLITAVRRIHLSLQNNSLKDKVVSQPDGSGHRDANKVTIVGAGQVGMACAMAMLSQGVTSELCLIDANKDKVKGEALDMKHGSMFFGNPHIYQGTDFKASENSKVVIITVGVGGKGKSRLLVVQQNAEIIKKILPDILKHSPKSIIVLCTNPVDVITYVTWKLSGLPKNRVIGTGTNLDSARFRYFISERLGVAPGSCKGWIIGEHGDSSVAVWSSVNVAGVRLRDLHPSIGNDDDPENWKKCHTDTITAAYKVIKLKGYTSWAIGLSTAYIVGHILRNTNYVVPVTTSAKGEQCIEEDIWLSLPCILTAKGVSGIVKQSLSEDEQEAFGKSAEVLLKVQEGVKL